MTHANSLIVELQNVTKRYGTFVAVDQLSLQVQQGEFLTLLGSSGCGKTTTLRMIAGLETVTTGSLWLEGRDVTYVPPYDRHIGLVFQDYALFPHLTIEDNVAFGLKMRGMAVSKRRQLAREMLDFVQLSQVALRKPHQLSGGQRQRVALARALLLQPTVLLLDEPLGALDAELRRQMQLELKRIQTQVGITFIYVTHDQEEALTMSDRIVILRQGAIEQVGTPQEIYEQPKTPFVAQFIGQCNLQQGKVISRDCSILTLEVAQLGVIQAHVQDSSTVAIGQRITVAIRPEKIRLSLQPQSWTTQLKGVLKSKIYVGAVTRLIVAVRETEIKVETHNASHFLEGESVYIGWHPEEAIALPENCSSPVLSYV